MSVAHHVTGAFPPAFISVGNADWLAPQSRIFADVVEAQGGEVERFFIPEDYLPKAFHEFQFNLDSDAGQSAMEQSIGFIRRSLR
jgi:acetyl esterase/lipase